MIFNQPKLSQPIITIINNSNYTTKPMPAGDKSSVDNILVLPSTSSGGKTSPVTGGGVGGGGRSVAGDKSFDKQSDKHFDKMSHKGGDNSHTSLASSHLSKNVGTEPSRKSW